MDNECLPDRFVDPPSTKESFGVEGAKRYVCGVRLDRVVEVVKKCFTHPSSLIIERARRPKRRSD